MVGSEQGFSFSFHDVLLCFGWVVWWGDSKLEHDRTRVSIPLKQEKELLWQMSRVQATKRLVAEFQAMDQVRNTKKASSM